jgi:hypothetical protein
LIAFSQKQGCFIVSKRKWRTPLLVWHRYCPNREAPIAYLRRKLAMSVAERSSSNALVPLATVHPDRRNDSRRQSLTGCRLGRALADDLSAESELPAIWAVGSVTADDFSRFDTLG